MFRGRWSRSGLVGMNVALLALLGVVTVTGGAGGAGEQAQPPGAGGRGRGEYTAVSGRIQGGNTNVVYLLDIANRELAALRWDRSAKRLELIGYRDLIDDAKGQQPGR